MRAYHPRVHFRGPRRYELSGILSNRKRKTLKNSRRRLRAVKVARRKGKALPSRTTLRKRKAATIKATRSVNADALASAMQKAKVMSSAMLTQHLFKNLTFTGVAQQNAAKALFLSRLQVAYLKLSTLKKATVKKPRLACGKTGVERLALKATRIVNQRQRELGL